MNARYLAGAAVAVVATVAMIPPAHPVITGPLSEDSYGWNCFIDGNQVCGSSLAVSGDDCLTAAAGYTMCRDGRVFTLEDGKRVHLVVRVAS